VGSFTDWHSTIVNVAEEAVAEEFLPYKELFIPVLPGQGTSFLCVYSSWSFLLWRIPVQTRLILKQKRLILLQRRLIQLPRWRIEVQARRILLQRCRIPLPNGTKSTAKVTNSIAKWFSRSRYSYRAVTYSNRPIGTKYFKAPYTSYWSLDYSYSKVRARYRVKVALKKLEQKSVVSRKKNFPEARTLDLCIVSPMYYLISYHC